MLSDVKALHYVDGEWIEGNPLIAGPMTHGLWMASAVFDGARSFNRLCPDLDRHCERVIASALAFQMTPPVTAKEIERLVWEGIERMPEDMALYIRPMFYFDDGFVAPDLGTTRFVLSLFDAPLAPFRQLKTTVSRYRRPGADQAPTDAKASCLYPNVQRALLDARGRGFDTAVMLDGLNNVAEFATANLFIAKDGVALTPVPNGTFLAGLTRRRVMELLRADGVEVREVTLRLEDLWAADEVFLTGNYSKVQSVGSVDDHDYEQGPVTKRARDLYMAFAEAEGGKKV